MHTLSNNTGSNYNEDLPSKEEFVESNIGWGPTTEPLEEDVEFKIIKFANSTISLDFLFKKYKIKLEETYSSSGWTFNTLCPFKDHMEKTPSFGFNPAHNRFNCFGCHRGGQSVDFISYKDNISKIDAAKLLLKFGGIEKLSLENINLFDFEKLKILLFDFSDKIHSFNKKNNFTPEAIAYSKAISWNVDVFLQQNSEVISIDLSKLEIRINKSIDQLQFFEED